MCFVFKKYYIEQIHTRNNEFYPNAKLARNRPLMNWFIRIRILELSRK